MEQLTRNSLKLFLRKKALKFFDDYPTINDSLSDSNVKKQLGEKKWELLKQAGRWTDDFYLRHYARR